MRHITDATGAELYITSDGKLSYYNTVTGSFQAILAFYQGVSGAVFFLSDDRKEQTRE